MERRQDSSSYIVVTVHYLKSHCLEIQKRLNQKLGSPVFQAYGNDMRAMLLNYLKELIKGTQHHETCNRLSQHVRITIDKSRNIVKALSVGLERSTQFDCEGSCTQDQSCFEVSSF